MIKKFLSLLLLTVLLFLPQPSLAQEDWSIPSFHSEVRISKDTSVKIEETIVADFKSLEKHGIFREIPVKYEASGGNRLNIHFSLLGVVNEKGVPYEYTLSYQGDNAVIKIGDPDITITGLNEYRIAYEVKRVITTPGDMPEFYWNVTGNDWPVNIDQVSATVTTEENGAVTEAICFTGRSGSTEQECSFSMLENGVAFISDREVLPGQGLTISTKIDENYLTFPSKWQVLLWFLRDNWIYLTPVLVVFTMMRLYWLKGRDKEYINIFSGDGSRTVPLFSNLNPMQTFAPPDDLSPGEVGVLVDERVHMRDVTSIAIDLARRGFFTIKETKKGRKQEFELTLKNIDESDLLPFETSILDMLFGKTRKAKTMLSKPQKYAYRYLDSAKKELYEHMVSEKFFESSPQKVRNAYLGIGIAVLFLSFFGQFAVATVAALALAVLTYKRSKVKVKRIILSILVGFFSWIVLLPLAISLNTTPVVISMAMSGVIIAMFSPFMPARTPKGRKALKEVVGLKEWIRIGAWREKIHEKHNFLEEVLPFAIAFGMTKKFLLAFKEAKLDLDWYKSQTPLTPIHLNRAVSSFDSGVAKGVSSTRPSSSASSGGSGFSGGSSGGGFGGGGGGSW